MSAPVFCKAELPPYVRQSLYKEKHIKGGSHADTGPKRRQKSAADLAGCSASTR